MNKIFSIYANIYTAKINILRIKITIKNKKKIIPKIIRKFIAKRQKYKIIPLGTYCFSRVITSLSNIKPQQDVGEKTCPFDLAFFYDLNVINNLLLTNFKNFYNDLEYDDENHYWTNKSLNAIFNHESNFTKKAFKARYDKRIKNLYDYMLDNKLYKYFLIATPKQITEENLLNLKSTLNAIIKNHNFTIIFINQSDKKINYDINQVKIIDQTHNNKILSELIKESGGCWVTSLKKLNSPKAVKIYSEITKELKKIIKR